mmetsp:Transcript_25454/g.37532  ORF Transcript_25454/g.37532 Transcript_25454/m.37532 type:complete len:448 (+) Transcript_25454:107-1450(+)|eukprot:CAMPEP_0185036724 /NCGR_PEP_ID=MMETSP1103-20130426/30088_1 /TAXON_ID=36769 /ORGANISM="Paraphysomonas bandaiensis, Strain Caron Lab Isolate" /LENGTH=447 /DNA_ID=CAMNT_0027574361 /DNA_START=53 /DNA_END=1396 /DNA_ORIENTATION=-
MEAKNTLPAIPSAQQPEEVEDDDEDLFNSSDESSDDEDGNRKTNLQSVNSYLRKKKKNFLKMFIDYGPPYTKMETGITLLDECALPEPSLFEIHSMLNARITPNFQDPEDYYNSAMHWCARHAHLRAMKLLKRAKVEMNPQNEFGQTPLHILCMMVFPEDKRKRQMKTFNWMLSQGSNINIRDKGGYCPIDYAAMNGHELMVEILLERGAEVLRDNHTFVATRQQLLHVTVGENAKRMIQDRIRNVVAEKEAEVERKRIEKAIAEEAANLKKRHARLARKRQEAIEAKAIADEREFQEKKEAEKKKKLEEDARLLRQERTASNKRLGGWKKKGYNGRWEYQNREGPVDKKAERDELYHSNRRLMKTLRDKNKFEVYNDRWKRTTGGSELEVVWTKQAVFDIPDLDSDDEKSDTVQKRKPKVIDSLAYHDENDAELEGEDIDDLLEFT